jgi:DNA invertase Pin-like site-specific DNA recombinase
MLLPSSIRNFTKPHAFWLTLLFHLIQSKMMTTKYKCLLLVRISTVKQMQESDSPEHQISRGLACAQKRYGYSTEEVFILTESWSGRKEDRPSLEQAFDMAQSHKLEKLLVYDIDRLTRAGVVHYELIKRRFKAIGCDIVDVKGVIQPDSNTLEGTGDNFGDDFTYDWSVFATSEKAEIMEAQMAKDEARKILSRTIPVLIKNAQLGRTNRWAPYGFKNCKIIDESGKPQPSKEIFEEEAFFVRRVFEGVASGRNTRTLADELNQLGYRSRRKKRWSADGGQVIGHSGGNPMTPRGVLDMIKRPVYAGLIVEKWTHGYPVKANHEGIVSVDLWNAANKKRWKLIEIDTSPTGWELVNVNQSPERRTYFSDRPEFPFKKLVLCSTCRKPLKGSFSKGKSGARFGYYHCNRGHKTVSASQKNFHEFLRGYLQEISFTPEAAQRFEKHIRDVWIEKVGGLNRHLISANKELTVLRNQADALFEKVKIASSPMIIKRLEDDYESLQQRIKLLEANRDHKEYSEDDANRVIKWARYLVEHLDELIIDTDNDGLRAIFWSLIFCATPTLEELQNRTPEFSPLVQLNKGFENQENALVKLSVCKSNTLAKELIRWADTFNSLQFPLSAVFAKYEDNQAKSVPKAA